MIPRASSVRAGNCQSEVSSGPSSPVIVVIDCNLRVDLWNETCGVYKEAVIQHLYDIIKLHKEALAGLWQPGTAPPFSVI